MVEVLLTVAAGFAGLAFVLALIRFVRGPVAVDRIIAFDVLTIVAITGIVFAALWSGRIVYMDAALVYALLSFLGVFVVARYVEEGPK